MKWRRSAYSKPTIKPITEPMPNPLPLVFQETHFRCADKNMPPSFAIVTAYNPDAKTSSCEQNLKFDKALKNAIDDLGLRAFRVTGGSIDFSHAEPGWGIVCTQEQARDLSVQFGQLAFFEIRNWQLYLLPTDPATQEEIHLGSWRERLRN